MYFFGVFVRVSNFLSAARTPAPQNHEIENLRPIRVTIRITVWTRRASCSALSAIPEALLVRSSSLTNTSWKLRTPATKNCFAKLRLPEHPRFLVLIEKLLAGPSRVNASRLIDAFCYDLSGAILR